jgi:hypothetical protein
MTTDIFICTCAKDFPWLKYCLRSIEKFTAGFNAVRILVPKEDHAGLQKLVDEEVSNRDLFHCLGREEWPGQGMNWHMAQIMYTDTISPADFIAHLDPDCVFTGPVTPDTYFRDGKPILRFENFHFIGFRHPGVLRWQECTTKCLPFPVHYETMRCHPSVYHRGLYAPARAQMEQKTGQPVPDYIRSCKNEYPQGFCEFVTLGNVAMQFFRDQYHLVEQFSNRVTPPNHVQQFWSHGPLDQSQHIWVLGEEKHVVPIQMLAELGLTQPPPVV